MDTTTRMAAIVTEVSGWAGVLALRPGPGDGSPEDSWGDVFFYVAPDGRVPAGQTLLGAAHQAALARWFRRHADDRPTPAEEVR